MPSQATALRQRPNSVIIQPVELAQRLEEAGFAAASIEAVTGGLIAAAGTATLRGGGRVFAKTLAQADAEADADMFEVEAAGLSALQQLGGVRVPAVVHVSRRLLVLEALHPRREERPFWEQLGEMVAALHTSTVTDRFGWHRDGWQGRLRQDNSWETDGHAVYEELARPTDGWRDQAQLLRVWDLFSTIAHGLDTWGAAKIVRTLIAPFRRS